MAKAFIKLTRHAMRSLPVGATITEHGITFERLSTRDGVFTINIMVNGTRIHRVVGRESDGTTRTTAEEYASKVRQEARENRLSLPKGRKTPLSFREAAEKYLKNLEEEGGKDLPAKRRRLGQHLTPFFGTSTLDKISSFDIERYKKKRTEDTAVPGGERQKPKDSGKLKATCKSTINRELAVLSHLLNKAEEWGWIESRPKIKRFQESPGRINYLTVSEIKRLLEAAQQDQSAQIYPFILIGLETGMRKMEILSIRREHVDLDRKLIYIPKAKNGVREQPITTHLAKFLDGYIEAM